MNLLVLILTLVFGAGLAALAFLAFGWIKVAPDESKRAVEPSGRKELSLVPSKQDWLVEDVEAYQAFLNTPTGAKLLNNSQALIAAKALESCGDVMHTSHSAGLAHGMNEFLMWQTSLASKQMLQSLSAPQTVSEEHNTSEDFGQSSLLERLSP